MLGNFLFLSLKSSVYSDISCDTDSSINHAFLSDKDAASLKDRFRAYVERVIEMNSQLEGVGILKAALNNKYYSTMLDNSYFIYNY